MTFQWRSAPERSRLTTPPQPWRRQMVGREHESRHRASTNLELLFDLTFVVAVAQAAHALAEHLIEGRVGAGVEGYVSVFFALWWAWVNFTWFASAFDTDDVPYRLLTLLQMSGVLVLAAGVPNAFDGDFTAVTVGYVLMRVAMIAQWLRAAASDPQYRIVCLRYAGGIAVVQVGWVARLGLPHDLGWIGFVLLALAEMAVPYWAERRGMTSWHPAHIAERYGLFTIIVLGEGISQVGLAVQTAFSAGGVTPRLVVTAVEGLILLFAMWWIYFARESGDALRERVQLAFFWGYGHYLVFASAAAVAAGIDVAITALNPPPDPGHHAGVALSHVGIALAVAIPVAVYLVVLGVMLGALYGDVDPRVRRGVIAGLATVGIAVLAVRLPLIVVGAIVLVPVLALVVEEIVVADRRDRSAAS
jgi:low temperature requirement protein LtrA